MIKNRDSEAHLSKEVILDKIRDIDIFSYYCPKFKKLGVKFCSDLREDNTPSVSIVNWQGKLLYKDFGHPEHTFDCFSYVMHKFSCSFYDALRLIDYDFNLNLSSYKDTIGFSMGRMASRTSMKQESKKLVIIKRKSRAWMKKDAEFWSQYLISKKTLTIFDVSPISYYWINANRFSCDLSYAYRIGNKYKIYSPYEDIKWISNTTKKHIQGYSQLPEKGPLCVITSSLKDVMCLYEIGISAIALQSEMQMPEESLIQELQDRFDEVVVFYDNDFANPNNPGQAMANKIIEKYFPMSNIVIPSKFGTKDLSDYIAKYKSLELARKLIEHQTLWQKEKTDNLSTTLIRELDKK